MTDDQSTRQNSLSSGEPVTKKANHLKSSSQENEKESKFTNTLDMISKTSSISEMNGKPVQRMTRTSSIISTQNSKKIKMHNVINETIDSKVMNEIVTIKKISFKEPLSRNNSTLKEISKNQAALNAKKTSKNLENAISKVQKDTNKSSELITDDDSSPERKSYKHQKEKVRPAQHKHITRSNNSLISEDEILLTPVNPAQQTKHYKGSAMKFTYKEPALFSPYAKDSVKNRVEAFEQMIISPKQTEREVAGRVTRTQTRALAAASFTEAPVPTVAQNLYILYVKKGYQDAPYHNWMHAFSVAHFAYLLMENLNLERDCYMTSLQALVFLVSCLCHDIDHRGTNNSFQTKCGSILASLYISEGEV